MDLSIHFVLTIVTMTSLIFAIYGNAYAQPNSIEVSIVPKASKLSEKAYQPNPIIVNQGDSIVWTNNDSGIHTVTEKRAMFNSGYMNSDQTYKFTFSKAGKFDYICEVHPRSMFGTVIVNPLP